MVSCKCHFSIKFSKNGKEISTFMLLSDTLKDIPVLRSMAKSPISCGSSWHSTAILVEIPDQVFDLIGIIFFIQRKRKVSKRGREGGGKKRERERDQREGGSKSEMNILISTIDI